jgi:hypothetical protein
MINPAPFHGAISHEEELLSFRGVKDCVCLLKERCGINRSKEVFLAT